MLHNEFLYFLRMIQGVDHCLSLSRYLQLDAVFSPIQCSQNFIGLFISNILTQHLWYLSLILSLFKVIPLNICFQWNVTVNLYKWYFLWTTFSPWSCSALLCHFPLFLLLNSLWGTSNPVCDLLLSSCDGPASTHLPREKLSSIQS